MLRKDLAVQFMGKDMEDGMDDHDQGWKSLRGDVFRMPPRRPWLCAMVGVGAQLMTMAVISECARRCGLCDDEFRFRGRCWLVL